MSRFERAEFEPNASEPETAGLGPYAGPVVVTCRAGTGPSITLDLGKCLYLNGHWVASI